MKVLIFGASGMVGQGVLRECVAAHDVTEVVAVVRQPLTQAASDKVRQLMRKDFFEWISVPEEFAGVDACFFCLGVTVLGKTEGDYRRVTYELTMAAAQAVLEASPRAVFVYVSGRGTDAQGRSMWARVKGETENALMAMRFAACTASGQVTFSRYTGCGRRWAGTTRCTRRWDGDIR